MNLFLLFTGILGPTATALAAPAPLALVYSSGAKTAATGQIKGLRAQIQFSAAPAKHPPVELPEEEILNVPGFDRVRAPGPAVRSPLSSESGPIASAQSNVVPNAPGDFMSFVSSSLSGLPASFSSGAPEPSVAVHDQVVFVTGNWYAALSTNNGLSFSNVDPYTTFPSVNNGFCCDQVTLYEPSRDLLVWGLQYVKDANGDTFRLAAAVGPANQAAGSFFYWDLTAQFFGYPGGYWLDFPDLSYGTNSLYFSSNVFTAGGSYAGTVVARLSLAEIAAGGTLNVSYLSQSVFGYKIAQGLGTTAYFATHTATNNVRILRWAEGSSTLFWDDVPVTAFQNGGSVCTDPAGGNWCGFADIRVSAAWRTNFGGGQIGVMWNSAQGGPFALARPYVQVAMFRESDRALVGETEIWNSSYAWQYASAGVNSRGDLAGTIVWGGGSYYISSAAWIWDDVNGHVLAPIENYLLAQGGATNGSNRWGDYFTARAHSHFTNSWVTVGVAPDATGSSEETFWWVGRRRDLPPAPNSDYYIVTPCRLIDTRRPNGTYGGPALPGGGAQRGFSTIEQCGVPIDATAIAVNVTVVQPTVAGDLRFYPAGLSLPLASVINFSPGQVRSNNAILSLVGSSLGSFIVRSDMASGSVHLVVDVTGYFR
ncbi:MAG TPA: hypothetical protein VGR07_00185 [Thermoanaerobaculia bacterium]|jgi:hypothetical protein|nr:hypothetical protein [Thermoanaerobaculia bacterium]